LPQEGNGFSLMGKTFWTELLYNKNFPVDGQNRRAKLVSKPVNLPSAWPSMKPLVWVVETSAANDVDLQSFPVNSRTLHLWTITLDELLRILLGSNHLMLHQHVICSTRSSVHVHCTSKPLCLLCNFPSRYHWRPSSPPPLKRINTLERKINVDQQSSF